MTAPDRGRAALKPAEESLGRGRSPGSRTVLPTNAGAPERISVRHYVVPSVIALVVLVIRWRLSPWLGGGVPTLALLSVVAIGIWYGGTRPALVVAVLGYAVSRYFMGSSYGARIPESAPLTDTVIYALFAALVITLGRHLRLLTRDVRARKRSEMDRAQILDSERHAWVSAEQANRLKDEFLAMISHELRTPLANVISWSRLLQAKYSGGAKTWYTG